MIFASSSIPRRSFAPAIVVAGVCVAGCAVPFPSPSDVAHIQLGRGHSPTVLVDKIWLERKDGALVVRGYVLKRLGVNDTIQTHLDVTLYDSAGTELRRTVEYFEPRQIPRRLRRADYAVYRIALDPLPPETARLEVKAHEGPHGSDDSANPVAPTAPQS